MIKEFRTAFRISQNEMALYLGISRSHLSMIEMGERELPNKKFIELTKFHQPVHAKRGEATLVHKEFLALRAAQKKEEEEMRNREILNHRHKLETVSRKIKKLGEDRDYCERIFEQMDNLYTIANKHEQGMIAIIDQQTKSLQENSGEDNLLKLRMQEAAIEAILKFLEGPDQNVKHKEIIAKSKKQSKKNPGDQQAQLSLL